MHVHSVRPQTDRSRPTSPRSDDAIETVLRGLGGHLCPSVTGYLERLIDRQAGLDGRGERP